MTASHTYAARPSVPSWPWLLAGAGLLAAGLIAFAVSPKLGLAALALPLAPLLVIAPQSGVLILAAALPFDTVSGLTPEGTVSLTRLLGFAVLGAWLLHAIASRRPVRLARGGKLLAAYVGFATVSVAWARDPSVTIESLRTLAQLFLLYVMVANVLRGPEDVARVLDVLLVSTALLAVLVLLQSQTSAAGTRATFTYGDETVNPNYLAASLVFPAIAALALGGTRGPLGWWRYASVLPIGIAVFSTGSRGGFLAFTLGVAGIASVRPKVGVRIAGCALIGALLLPMVVPERLAERVWARYATAQEDRLSGRLDIWRVGFAMVRDRPLQGLAFGGFRDAFYDYMLETPVDPRFALMHSRGDRAAHNIYLANLAELGLIGAGLLVASLAAHGVAVWRVRRRAKRAGDELGARVALGLTAVFAALVVFGGSIDLLTTKIPWLLLAMMQALVLQQVATRRPVRSAAPRSSI